MVPTTALKTEATSTMSLLLGLAHEILYHIIDVVDPGDIESFSASCKTIKLLAKAVIEEHRSLHHRYDVIEFGDGGEVVGPHPLFLLRDIILNPRVRYYPTDMRIRAFDEECMLDFDEDFYKDKEQEQIQIASMMEEHGDDVRLMLSRCVHIEAAELENWYQKISRGYYDAVFALLLTLLPNIQSITVVRSPDGLFRVMVARIARSSIDSMVEKPRSLSRLRRLVITTIGEGGDFEDYDYEDFSEGTDLLRPFAELPSMQSISGTLIQSGDEIYGGVLEWTHAPRSSRVTELSFERCRLVDNSLPNLFSGIKDLKKFTYSLGGMFDEGNTYQPHRIISSLALHFKCSLEFLYITGAFPEVHSRDNDHKIPLDLQAFKALKDMRVDHTLFQDFAGECHTERVQSNGEDETRHYYPSRRLVDMLPASIETIKLEGKLSEDRAQPLLAGLGELKGDRVPRLQKVVMNSTLASQRQMVAACEAVGVTLVRKGGPEGMIGLRK